MRHQRRIVAKPIKPEAFAHITIDRHAHVRDPLDFHVRSAYRGRTRRGYQHRLKRRNESTPLAPCRYGPIDLLSGFDDVNPGEGSGQGRAGAFPGAGRAQKPASWDWRDVERLAPCRWREPGVAQQVHDLRARIRASMAER